MSVLSYIFDSKERKELRAVRHIVKQQEQLTNGNLWLEQVAARINRHGSEEEHFALLLHDLQRFADEDRTSGALQLNMPARPLLLVLDIGLERTALALVRGGKQFAFERKVLLKTGGVAFEEALAVWVKQHFVAHCPALQKEPLGRFIPSAQRLCALLCLGAPHGEIEETVVIDSQAYVVNLPFVRDELVPAFCSLLGSEGSFLQSLRQFLTDNSCPVARIDRVVCLGVFGRLPLLREALAEALQRSVLLAERMAMITMAESLLEIYEREKREKEELEERKRQEEEDRQRQMKAVKSVVPREQNVSNVSNLKSGFILTKLTAMDTATNLIWARNGNIAGKKMNWRESMIWVNKLNYSGHTDWRLPTKDELEAFSRLGGKRPSDWFNANGISGVQANFYWADSAWVVSMFFGGVSYSSMTHSHYVWLVRLGQ